MKGYKFVDFSSIIINVYSSENKNRPHIGLVNEWRVGVMFWVRKTGNPIGRETTPVYMAHYEEQ